jgi:hypothetical protein
VCLEAEHKVTHTVSGGQLSKDHAQHLTPTGECSDFLIPGILLYQAVEDTTGKKICKLSEDIFALIHCLELLGKAKTTFQFKSSRSKRIHNYAIIKDFKERCLI